MPLFEDPTNYVCVLVCLFCSFFLLLIFLGGELSLEDRYVLEAGSSSGRSVCGRLALADIDLFLVRNYLESTF